MALTKYDGRSPMLVEERSDGHLIGVSGEIPLPAVACSAADVHAPAAATAAVVTYAAQSGMKHCLGGVAWSYSAAPTGGNLTITDNAATVFTVDITAAGPGFFMFPRPIKQGVANKALVITLASGGGTVVGKVNGINHWYEA